MNLIRHVKFDVLVKQLSNFCRMFDWLSRRCSRSRIVEFYLSLTSNFTGLHMHLIPKLDSAHVK